MELKKNVLYEIYDSVDQNNDFYVGYFVAKDEENFVFQSVNPDGFDDGLVLLKTDEIFKFEFDTRHCVALDKLIQHHGVAFKKYELNSDDLLRELLIWAKDAGAIVAIGLSNSEYVDSGGFVEELDDDYTITKEIDKEGYPDGNGVFKISDIEYLRVNAYNYKKYKILYEINSKSSN